MKAAVLLAAHGSIEHGLGAIAFARAEIMVLFKIALKRARTPVRLSPSLREDMADAELLSEVAGDRDRLAFPQTGNQGDSGRGRSSPTWASGPWDAAETGRYRPGALPARRSD